MGIQRLSLQLKKYSDLKDKAGSKPVRSKANGRSEPSTGRRRPVTHQVVVQESLSVQDTKDDV